jgi:hypothetical protein
VQARIRVPWADLAGTTWKLTDMLADVSYEREGDGMLSPGLYAELRPWGYHFFDFEQAGTDRRMQAGISSSSIRNHRPLPGPPADDASLCQPPRILSFLSTLRMIIIRTMSKEPLPPPSARGLRAGSTQQERTKFVNSLR